MPTHITVTAPPGRLTPVHPNDGVDPSGTLHAEDGYVCRVRYSQDVRRSIGRGDMIPCTMDGAPCAVDLARAPEDLPGGRIAITRAAKAKKGPQ